MQITQRKKKKTKSVFLVEREKQPWMLCHLRGTLEEQKLVSL